MNTIILATLENTIQASILRDVLENEGIESFVRNEILSSVFGNVQGFQVEVLVFEEDYDKALEIFKRGFPDLEEGEE